MPSICFYFQVHQPFRLGHYQVQHIGENDNYFDDEKNKEIFRKVSTKCYLPTNALLLELCEKHPEFRISFSLSGVFLDQCELWGQDVLNSFKKLVNTGQVEILGETAYHSLAGLYSKKEFSEQIRKHIVLIQKHFGVKPKVFRNTELIYNNEIAEYIRLMGFEGILAEGADHVLGWRSPNHLYRAQSCTLPKKIQNLARKYNINQERKTMKARRKTNTLKRNRKLISRKLPLLLKNYKLSDDIAFRFSNKEWREHPLSCEKFANWIENTPGETINLFMDYETFGEHQWEDTGIFEFLRYLPKTILDRGISFKTPSETIESLKPIAQIDMHNPVSWADTERDLSAWCGNNIQKESLHAIYDLEPLISKIKKMKKRIQDSENIVETWRKLQTSDQFYYMCTKYWSDGDVHKYFSPFDSPYDAYIYFMNSLSDFENRIKKALSPKP